MAENNKSVLYNSPQCLNIKVEPEDSEIKQPEDVLISLKKVDDYIKMEDVSYSIYYFLFNN